MLRRTAAVIAVVCTAALVVPTAAADGNESASKATTRGIRYTFEHLRTVDSGSRIRDVLGKRQNARVRTAEGGTLRIVKHQSGHGVRFPKRCLNRGCPRAILTSTAARRLNSRGRPFIFGAQVRVTPQQTAPTSTVIQKGSFTNPRRWRLKLNGATARPYCLVKGAKGLLRMHSVVGIADGRWHRVSCKRDGRTVSLSVDGIVVATKSGPVGPVRNHSAVRVGGFSLIGKNNQYFGSLDNVKYKIH